MRALDALLVHPDIAGIHGQVVAGGTGAEHDHAAALADQCGHGECGLAGVLEHHVDVVALAGEGPDGLAELARRLEPGVVFRRVDRGHLAPAVELLAVDDTLGAKAHHEVGLVVLGNHADGIAAGGGNELNGHRAEAARGAPHEYVLAGLEGVRAMAEQHAVGGRQRQRVAGSLFPGQVLRARHQLAGLDAAELGEGAVGRLVAPDALRGGEHRVAAVAFFVVAVILVAVNDDLVANLPASDLAPHGPHDARGVGSGDMEIVLVAVERRDRNAERSPHAVVVDARGHHQHEHLV